MADRAGLAGDPASFVDEAAGGIWPDGPFVDGTPVAARYAGRLVARLAAAMAATGDTQSSLADKLELSRSTVNRLLGGRTYPDFAIVAMLEEHFDTPLWPGPELASS